MRVLYIGGAGRSGSTLLDMILGHLPGFFSVGELRFFWEYQVRGDIACGCGKKLEACEFWSVVKERLNAEDVIDFDRMAMLSSRFNRTRNLPWLMVRGAARALKEWQELAGATEALYCAVEQVVGEGVLVDASKAPSQVYLLRNLPGLDLRILHLVRDGRAVAYSWSKRRKQHPAVVGHQEHMAHRSAWRAMLVWAVENALTFKLSRAASRYALLRYEDLAENPYDGLSRALERLGLESAGLEFLQKPTLSLGLTHGLGGNPVRFLRPGLSIAPDNEWRDKMNVLTRLLLGIVAFPVLLRFGYRPW